MNLRNCFLKVVGLFFFLNFFLLFSQKNAQINISLQDTLPGEVKNELFGTFFEFVPGHINGSFGLYAQELIGRGFDFEPCQDFGVACPWRRYSTNFNNSYWELKNGGYNDNGSYCQIIANSSDSGSVGVSQSVILTDSVAYQFYIYCRSDDTILPKLYIEVTDSNNKEFHFESVLGQPEKNWKKLSLSIPPLYKTKAVLLISFKGKGKIELDEASLMPENNRFGIRNEYYSAFSDWKPTIIRYPGGWFADCIDSRWEYGIGSIDKRTPRGNHGGYAERMDFGTDEFVAFCKSINSEPHIVTNILRDSAEGAANWVEYCNSPSNTKFGALRTINGNPDSYNIKYWGCGNEEYDCVKISNDFVSFVTAMKRKDPKILSVYDGQIWGKWEYIDTVMMITREVCDIYGWHMALEANPKKIKNDDRVFLAMMSWNTVSDIYSDTVSVRLKRGSKNKITQGITELWSVYDHNWDWAERSYSLENGLWTALHLNTVMRQCHTMSIFERTHNSGMFSKNFNKSGKRMIVPSPSFYAMSMAKNHHGMHALKTDVVCDKFSIDTIDTFWPFYDVLWIDAVSTLTNDTLFLSVVNRSIYDTSFTILNLDTSIKKGEIAKVYQLTSNSFVDSNYSDEPRKVYPKENFWEINDYFYFPPHSFTIIAFPFKKSSTSFNDSSSFKFQVFPNPFVEYIVIKGNSITNIISIKMFDYLGKELIHCSIKKEENLYFIKPEKILKGVYFIRIESKLNNTIIPVLKSE